MVEDVDGNRFLDFMAGIAVASTGYGHPKVVAAIKAQADKFLHICGYGLLLRGLGAALRAAREARARDGAEERVFSTNSGAEAVDGAIKLARNSHQARGADRVQGRVPRAHVWRDEPTSSKVKQHAGFGPLLPGVYHVQYANPYRCDCGQAHSADCQRARIEATKSCSASRWIRATSRRSSSSRFRAKAATSFRRREFLPALRALCDKHGILLVCDEIQCGVGRTGKMWATEFAGSSRTSCSRQGARLRHAARRDHREGIDHEAGRSGAHGSTFGGNPVPCAAAMATLDVVEGAAPESAARSASADRRDARAAEEASRRLATCAARGS